jgi:hypothetical protein
MRGPAQDPRRHHLVEDPEERLREELARQVRAQAALPLGLLDDAVDELEVVLERGGGEAFHELRGLAQLHLEDDGQVGVAAQELQVMLGDDAQPFRA